MHMLEDRTGTRASNLDMRTPNNSGSSEKGVDRDLKIE